MPRHRRLEIPGAIYHVIARGLERREIFRDDNDRNEFLRRFSEGLKKTGSKCYGWVLMPNHFHLLIASGKRPLSDLMRKLLTGYALYFNHRYKRCGYVYQNRYKPILCQEQTYLLELVRYIHLNPVRSHRLKDATELSNYKWTGHATITGNVKSEWQSVDEVLERFGSKRSDAIKGYIEYIKDGEKMGHRDELAGGGLRRSAGGWHGVMELRSSKEYWRGDERILGDGDFVNRVLSESEEELTRRTHLQQSGWDIDKIVKRACEILEIKEADVKRRGKNNKVSQARSMIAYWGNKELGVKATDLARYFGISKQSISEAIQRGEIIVNKNGHYLTT